MFIYLFISNEKIETAFNDVYLKIECQLVVKHSNIS